MALVTLSLALLCISALSWITLQRVDDRLQDFHRQSLTQVAQAIDLSKRTSDLATSAPYLLNQGSNFLIEQEGEKLVGILERVRDEWPEADASDSNRDEIFPVTREMESGILDLVEASRSLDQIQAQIRARVAKLSALRETSIRAIDSPSTDDAGRLAWWTLQSMTADALNAAYADNLIGVGEEQRHYQRQDERVLRAALLPAQLALLEALEQQVAGPAGVFELRRVELGHVLEAQNALFRIRRDANRVNELAVAYARAAETFLTAERNASSSTLQLTRISLAGISLFGLTCALMAALFVSRYVAFNIARVSEAMVRLANGDRDSALPRRLGGDDEIGDLFRSFRSFRANTLRMDRSHRQLNQRNALFEKVFANISDGIAITDATGRLTASNPAFSQILGLSDHHPAMGNFVDWLAQSRFADAAQARNLGSAHRGTIEIASDDGQILEMRASRLPDDGRVWLMSDVTEQRSIEARIDQIDRIETLGKLAGDTAHDFGNVLSTIRTHAHLMQREDGGSDHVSAIENAVEFGASLTDRLLAFARKQPLIPEVLDLNILVEGMIELVEIGLKPGVSITVRSTGQPLNVLADPGQLESAILNLVLNANNAIADVGSIDICLTHDARGNASIIVTDTGVGMPDQIRQKAIEPFFTTRSAEGGTGLGLSIVHGFINQTGGTLDIDSCEGRGTTVSITLPLAKAGHGAAQTRHALLVDDNPKDRGATKAALLAFGYNTTDCGTLKEAFAALDAQRFDLILSDFDLGPEDNGIDFLTSVAHTRPAVRRVLISAKAVPIAALPDGLQFFEKPVSPDALASLDHPL